MKLFSTVASGLDEYDRKVWKLGEPRADAEHAKRMRAARLMVESPERAAKKASLDVDEQAALAAMLSPFSTNARRVFPALIELWVDVAGAAFAVRALARSTELARAHGDKMHATWIERWSWLHEASADTA